MKYFLLFLCCVFQLRAETFGPWAEPAMPFLESVVDFRDWEKQGFPKENLVVRGVILKLPNNIFVCYDTDLLRVAGIWEGDKDGKFLTETSIASISYHTYNKKSDGGQKDLPKPIGKPLAATGRYFGWAIDGKVVPDPRPVPANARELGRGPVPRKWGGGWGWIIRAPFIMSFKESILCIAGVLSPQALSQVFASKVWADPAQSWIRPEFQLL